MTKSGYWAAGVAAMFSLVAVFLIACGSGSVPGSTTTAMGTGSTAVSISDPATCAGTRGRFAHVYVTITDVRVHTSATAGDSDPGWKDLTPSLSSSPQQIDLLGQANNQCFLATLGDAQQLQAGTYQQIRIILADNTVSVANNQCAGAGAANCVVLNSDNNPYALQLSSEAKTGLKIPSGQIASGGFTIGSGQTKDLNIDFDTCASIVQEGNGKFRLKPVLHGGEVSTTSTSINGKVLDKATNTALTGSVLVALEQKDATGVDRIMMTTLTKADGTFVFCPIPAGTYDVVVVGESSGGVVYAPAIVTGIANGETTGTIALNAPLVATATLSTATLTGTVTSQNASHAGTPADVGLSALETVGSTVYTMPLVMNAQQSSATTSVSTAAGSGCTNGTDCASYSMVLPSAGAYVGAYSTAGVTLTQSSTFGTYVVDGIAYVPSSGGTLDCSPSELKSQSIAVTAGGALITVNAPLAFTSCQ